MGSPTRPLSAVTTRPATQADYQFLYTLHKLALGPYVEATWGWDEEAQRKLFRDAWEPTANQVVLLGGEPIGCLRVEEHDDHVFVNYIAPHTGASETWDWSLAHAPGSGVCCDSRGAGAT
jgi:hypothetical protein